MLAFESRSAATVDDYKIGLDGDVTPGNSAYSGATYYDYNFQNDVVGNHGTAGSYYSVNYYQSCCYIDGNIAANWFDSSAGTIVTYSRPDALTDGSSQIQGVRDFNSDTSQWSSPDQ